MNSFPKETGRPTLKGAPHIFEYIRDSKGRKKGVIVATSVNNIGWSMCHKNDSFDINRCFDMATGRAFYATLRQSHQNIPDSIKPQFLKFIERAHKYFTNTKGKNVDRNKQ